MSCSGKMYLHAHAHARTRSRWHPPTHPPTRPHAHTRSILLLSAQSSPLTREGGLEQETTRDFEQRRKTWKRGIPQVTFDRSYDLPKPVEKFIPENTRKDFDASKTMPMHGARLDGVVGQNFSGRLSLLDALKFKDWEAVRAHTGMVACTVADDHGRLPLLLALTGGAPADVSLGILKANPQAAAKPDAYGNLPLHIAITRQLEIELIVALHKAHPKASEVRDEFNDLPLHLALKQTQPVERPEEVVEEAAPEPEVSPWWATAGSFMRALGAEQRGEATEQERGSGAAPITSLSQLLSATQGTANSDSANSTDNPDDVDPLGVWKLRVVRTLLNSNPHAALERSGNGKLTLHLATEARTAPEIMLVSLFLSLSHTHTRARAFSPSHTSGSLCRCCSS